jgi:hypothetical protein
VLIGGKGLEDRTGISEPAGLNHDPAELRHLPALALEHEMAQRNLQIGARGAADAAVAEQHRVLARLAHQCVVDADGTELIDDDSGAVPFRCLQESLQQRSLASAEKSGDDGDRNARAARTFKPAAEWPCLAGREQIERQKSISKMYSPPLKRSTV